MRFGCLVLALVGLLIAPSAQAKVRVAIDLTSQTMRVDGAAGRYVWPISSARSGFSTPHGSYAPTSLQRMHYSRKYHMSPMPYSIFFRGGYAIHGTYSTAELGRPASHGCVRLAPGHAARLFQMVQAEGAAISITGVPPQGSTLYARAPARPRAALGYAPAGYAPPIRVWQQRPAYDDDGYGYDDGYRWSGRALGY